MKKIRIVSRTLPLGLLVCLPVLNLQTSSCLAQGTAFTYQGRLNDGANPANGTYELRLVVFDASTGGTAVGGPVTNAATGVTNGLFTVTFDFGNGVFDGNSRWLEVAVRTNGVGDFTPLTPRELLTATPYALIAGNVTSTNIPRLTLSNTSVQATGHPIVTSGFVTSALVDNGGAGYVTAPSVAVFGTGSGALVTSSISNGAVVSMTVQNAGSGYSNATTLTIGAPPPHVFQEFASSNFFSGVNMLTNQFNVIAGDGSALAGVWLTGGNTSVKTPTPDFLGRLDNQPLAFRVNNQRVFVLVPTTNGPNVIAGFSNNLAGPGATSVTIGGGGKFLYPNQVNGTFGTISGGRGNLIQTAIGSTIGGGELNEIDANLDSSTISGGFENLITGTAALGGGSVIGGGIDNIIGAPRGIGGGFFGQADTIGGGFYNVITTNTSLSTIGGGNENFIDGSSGATIAGGDQNWIGTANAGDSTIGGGLGNSIGVPQSITVAISGANAIGGGNRNTIGTNANLSTIAGGAANIIGTNAVYASIGGGLGNTIAPNSGLATIPGGDANAATNNAFAAGHRAKANHTGAFVWADSTEADFASTAANQFLIRAASGVGIGVTNPSRELEVQHASDTELGLKSTDVGGHLWTVQSSGVNGGTDDASFQVIDRTSGGSRLFIGTNGFVGIGTVGPTNRLHVNGGISATAFVTTSDRNAKENFAPVNPREVLNKVAELPILIWNYKERRDGEHMGPTAQDFYAAFGLGGSDKTITTVDPDGVALAAIQGLNEKLEAENHRSEARIRSLEVENAELKQRLEKLEKLIHL